MCRDAQVPWSPWASVAYKDVGKGREQELKLTPLWRVDEKGLPFDCLLQTQPTFYFL